MAVAASADYFGVFALRSSDVLQSQMRRGELDPISEVLLTYSHVSAALYRISDLTVSFRSVSSGLMVISYSWTSFTPKPKMMIE